MWKLAARRWLAVAGLFATLAPACGGQSLSTSDGDEGGSGGTSSGGAGIGGTAISGGTGGTGFPTPSICTLPLETGPCDGFSYVYGFSVADGNCQSFVYGLCGGNENRFGTLEECEARCGGSLHLCPARRPDSLMCSNPMLDCSYDQEGCLCAPREAGGTTACSKVDPSCALAAVSAPPPGGDAPVPPMPPPYQRCVCSEARWVCAGDL